MSIVFKGFFQLFIVVAPSVVQRGTLTSGQAIRMSADKFIENFVFDAGLEAVESFQGQIVQGIDIGSIGVGNIQILQIGQSGNGGQVPHTAAAGNFQPG